MPVVVVQVGQAGNQVGAALWELLREEEPRAPGGSSGRPPPRGGRHRPAGAAESSVLLRRSADGAVRARAVMVDTEPKARLPRVNRKVRAALRSPGGSLLDPERCVLGHSGCANNWAYGYLVQQSARELERSAGGREEPILSRAMQAIRQEVECCRGLVEFLLIHSVAGGSGSGLGSRILEELRATYPLSCIVTASVLPSLTGDTPVQSLNTCLTLQWLNAYADGSMLFRNDALVSSLQQEGAGGASVSLQQVNRYIARCLAGLLLPAPGGIASPHRRCFLPLRQLVMQVCPSAEMKFFEVHHSCVDASSVRGKFDTLDDGRPAVSTGTLVVARDGCPAKSSPTESLEEVTKAFARSSWLAHVTWREDAFKAIHTPECPAALHCATPTGSTSGDAKVVTIAANRSAVISLLRHLAGKAGMLCRAGAYMHWYERHGCPKEAIEDAVRLVHEVADCYAHWHLHHRPPLPNKRHSC